MMTGLFQRAAVVLRALPTYLAVAAAALPFLAGELTGVLPEPISGPVTRVLLLVGGLCAAAVATIRHVTPIARTGERPGLLPSETIVALPHDPEHTTGAP